MKTMFFAIVITLFAKSVIANPTDPIIFEKHGKVLLIHASLPAKKHEEVVYKNGKAIRTNDGTYLFVKSAAKPNETIIFFREENGFEWKLAGRICSDFEKVGYVIKNNGWQLEVDGNGCEHLYEKVLTLRGAAYREVK